MSASQAFGSMSFILQVSNLSRRRSNSFFRLPHHAKLVRQRFFKRPLRMTLDSGYLVQRSTVDRSDCVAIEASRDRLELADKAGALEMGLDLADTIQADNSMEKMNGAVQLVWNSLTFTTLPVAS